MPAYPFVLIVGVVVALASGMPTGQSAETQPAAGQDPAAKAAPRTDQYGDPLPDGAVARFGSARFRHAGLSAYVVQPDDQTVLTAGSDRILRFWDLTTGRPKRAVALEGKAGPGSRVLLSPDGKTLVAHAPVIEQLVFWEVDTGKELKRLPAPKDHIGYLCFSPDGKTLAVGRNNWRVSLWDWELGKERDFPLAFHPRPGVAFHMDSSFHGHFSPDGKWFVAGASSNEPLGVFQAATGREVHRLNAFALTSRVSPDSKQLAVLSSQNDKGEELRLIRLFDLASGKEAAQIPLGKDEQYDSPVWSPAFSLAFSPNGNILACGFTDRSCLVDRTTGRVLHHFRFSGRQVAMAFSRDGKTLIAGTGQRLHTWDVASGKELNDRPGEFGYAPVVAVSPDGRRLASGDWMAQVVSVWDTTDGRLLRRLPLKGQQRYVGSVDFSDNGRTVFAGQAEGLLQWWDAATGNEEGSVRLQELDGLRANDRFIDLRLSPDRKRVYTLHQIHTGIADQRSTRLALWDAGSGKPLARHLFRTFPGHVAWLGGGKSAVVAVDDGLTLMDLPSGTPQLRFAGKAVDRPLAVSPDGRLLAGRRETACGKHQAGMIVVWEIATGKQVASIATDGFGQMALMPDNRRVVTTEYGVVCIRDLATGAVRHRWPMPDGETASRGMVWVKAMILSPDGRRAFTVVADGTAFAWDLTAAQRPAEPPVKEPSLKELAAWWADLLGDDAAKAQRAVWAMVDAPNQAVPFLTSVLKPVAGPDEKKVRRWIADLDSDDFNARQTAQQELDPLAEMIEPLVHDVLKGKVSIETRRRLEQLLANTNRTLTSDALRQMRAVQALELICTQQARALLEDLTKGAAGARQTREAQESLERLVRRSRMELQP